MRWLEGRLRYGNVEKLFAILRRRRLVAATAQRLHGHSRTWFKLGKVKIGRRSGPNVGQSNVRTHHCRLNGVVPGWTSWYDTRMVWDHVGGTWLRGSPVHRGRLEDNALVVTFAMAFGFDAVVAYRPLLAALDPPLSASQASGLGPLTRHL